MADTGKVRSIAVGTSIIFALSVSACGGGGGSGGGISSTPPPPPAVTPPPPPPPPPASNFDTAEYQQSNGAVQAQAIAAYNAGATGTGVIAGVVDSGIDIDSPEFSGKIHPQSGDFAGTRGLQDEGGHGSAVSSILLGAKNNLNAHGVAFGATLLVLRTDTPGTCTDPDPDAGCTHNDNDMARAVDRAVSVGARVINMSLGGSPMNSNLRAAVDRATAAGIVIVISAGNEFDTDPANAINPDPMALTALDPIARGQILIAGATDSNQQISTFSNRAGTGQNYYITALGVRVRAPDETGAQFLWSGTSFSAPIVSGAVALLAQAFPNLTGRQIVDLLLSTTTDLGAAGTDAIYGRGELNLARAFQPQGQQSIAGTPIPVPTAATATLGGPMGDATVRDGPKAIILDSYGRAFNADFSSTLLSAKSAPKLAPALSIGTETRTAANPNLAVSLSVANRRDGVGPDRLDLSPRERGQARAIAGSVIAKLGNDRQFALGIARSSGALIDQMAIDRAASFIAADAAQESFGFFSQPSSAFAYRQQVAGFGMTVAGESGDVRLWKEFAGDPMRSRYRGYGYRLAHVGLDRELGALRLKLSGTLLDERETILGGGTNMWTGETGARSWFADAGSSLVLGSAWRVDANYRRGWTRIAAAGLRESADWLESDAWSADLTRLGLFSLRDSLSLRVAQPLRVRGGGLNLTLPVGYDYSTLQASFGRQFVSLAPTGRERDIEAAYATPFAGGYLSANAFWRTEPGHIEAAPDDLGVALRFNRRF